MKKISALLLIGVLGAALLIGCGKSEDKVEYNTFDNNTSEEYIDPETGANLKDTIEDITEESGIIPEDEQEGDPEETLEIVEEETTPETDNVIPDDTSSEASSTEG